MKSHQDAAAVINPWFSRISFAGISSIIVITFVGYAFQGLFPSSLIKDIEPIIFTLGSAHIVATGLWIYLDWNELRSGLFRYLWIPVPLILAYVIFMMRRFPNISVIILFYGITLHTILQGFFITQIYNLIQGRYQKIDAVINGAALIIGPLYFSIFGLMHGYINYGGLIKNIPVNQHVLTVMKLLTLLAAAVFIGRQVYVYYKQKKLVLFNISMVLTANSIFYLAFLFFKSDTVFRLGGFKYYHGLQYLIWVSLYLEAKFRDYSARGIRFVSNFHLPHKTASLIVFFIIIASIYAIIQKMTQEFDRSDILLSTYYFFMVFHIYVDGFVWWNFSKIARLIAVQR